MNITVFRGSHEIGGSCIAIKNAAGEILLLDAGMPLESAGKDHAADQTRFSDSLAALHDSGKLIGVLYSHIHMDHIGFDGLVPSGIPRFLGTTSIQLLRFKTAAGYCANTKILDHPGTYNGYTSGNTFPLGDFSITPWLMDHSAVDSHALVVESDGQRVVYTGDFRTHGRKPHALARFLKEMPPGVDAVLCEGTTLARDSSSKANSEKTVEDQLTELAKKTPGHVFVQCSSENIDRLVGMYRACKRSGRTLVVDLYTALILELVHQKHQGIPAPGQAGWENLKVWYPHRSSKKLVQTLGAEATVFHFRKVQMKLRDLDSAGKIMMLVRPSCQPDLEKWLPEKGDHAHVYSLWAGYLDQEYSQRFCSFMEARGAPLHQIHSSGHADRTTIGTVLAALNPQRIIPVHTNNPECFLDFSNKVLVVADGEEIELDAPIQW